jgi:hypothetical protein
VNHYQPRPDAFDLWGNGVPFATGIQTYQDAVRFGRMFSGRWPDCMLYMVYSGAYVGCPMPRPLAAFCNGSQLPVVIRLADPVEARKNVTGYIQHPLKLGLLPASRVQHESATARLHFTRATR